MAQEKLITRITEMAGSLNERQRAYLVNGLLVADSRKTRFKITPSGQAVAVEEAENWKPFSGPACGAPGWIEHVMSRVRS